MIVNLPSRICRICLDGNRAEDFISPCLCSGGSAFVHRSCLDEWRSVNKCGKAFRICDVCQFEYVIEPMSDDVRADRIRLIKFLLYIIRDIGFLLIILNGLIVGLTFIIKAADSHSHKIKNLFPQNFSTFGIYYLAAWIVFFAILGAFGLISFCCGLDRDNENMITYTSQTYYSRHNNCCIAIYCLDCHQCCHNCGNCDCGGACDCDSGDTKGGDGLMIVVVIVLVLAAIGVVVGIFLSVIILRKLIKRHSSKLWLKQQTTKYIVKDFQFNRDELNNIRNQRLSLRNQNNVQVQPSAPPEVFSMKTLDLKNTADES